MRKRRVQVKTLFVLVGTLVAVAAVLLSAASAKTHEPRRPAAGRGADLEHERGQRGSCVDADEGADRRHGLHVVRAGGGVRRGDEARGPLPALPRLHGRGRPGRLGAGGGRGGGADDPRLLPARPAGDRRRRVQRLPRDADGRRRRRRRGRRGGGATTSSPSAPATGSRRRRRATGRSGRSCPGSGSCSRVRRCRRRGSRRCVRSCSSRPRSSGPSRRRR